MLQVSRGHWFVMQMREQIIALAAQWQVDLVIVEDTSSGMGLIQFLKEEPRLDVVGRKPDTDKVTRMSRQQGRFEAGRILLPKEARGSPISRASSSRSRAAATTTRSTHYCYSSSGSRRTSAISSR